MAKTRTSPITLRLVFNRNAKHLDHRRFNAASRFIANEVAINASDDYWKNIRANIQTQVSTDLRREMSHLAQEYRRLIVGISGNNVGAQGTLRTVAEPAYGGARFASYHMNVPWESRARNYLEQKKRKKKHTRWFEYNDELKSTMGKQSTWFDAYGPVQVKVTRKGGQSMSQEEAASAGYGRVTRNTSAEEARTLRFGVGGSSVRVQVAIIRVFAMRSITPQMLPALASGSVDDWAPDGVATGLISRFPTKIQHSLAGNRKFVPYRHTVEPFLAFFLTRAIPNAVMRRLEESLHANIGRIS